MILCCISLWWMSVFHAGYHHAIYDIIIVILSVVMLNVFLLTSVSLYYVSNTYCYSECHNAECRYAECLTIMLGIMIPCVIQLMLFWVALTHSAVTLSVLLLCWVSWYHVSHNYCCSECHYAKCLTFMLVIMIPCVILMLFWVSLCWVPLCWVSWRQFKLTF